MGRTTKTKHSQTESENFSKAVEILEVLGLRPSINDTALARRYAKDIRAVEAILTSWDVDAARGDAK